MEKNIAEYLRLYYDADRSLRAEASCAVDNREKIYRLETADNIRAEYILVLFSLRNIRWISPPWRFRLSSWPTCHLVLLGRTREATAWVHTAHGPQQPQVSTDVTIAKHPVLNHET